MTGIRLGNGDRSASSDAHLEAERERFLDDLLASDAHLKLIVAGPGTGKTFSFRKVLETRPEPKLVLTFINSLVADLERELGGLAEVKTFHRFCHGMLHRYLPEGVTHDVDYHPPVTQILAVDVSSLLGSDVRGSDIEGALHNLESENQILTTAVQCGNYYNAVGHADCVYRVSRHFEDHPEVVPRYSQIVVDEFQDFNLLEVRLIELLSAVSPTLVVGDDDQALYEFKHASASYLRELVSTGKYEEFPLPYCSRCTEVLVDAVNRVVEVARGRGLLEGRLSKSFYCYTPSKRFDSKRYPSIIHAQCTVQTKRAPYMTRYIKEQIREIPDDDVEESCRGNYPTVLVVGPVQFTDRIYPELSGLFRNVNYKRSEQPRPSLLDGYVRLLCNPASRLGWRIIAHLDEPDRLHDSVRTAMRDGKDIADYLPSSYRERHTQVADLLRSVRDQAALQTEEVLQLERALQIGLDELKLRLDLGAEQTEAQPEEQAPEEPPDEDARQQEPRIVVATLVGAKGLQASHVFVVGVNGGHFPRDNRCPTDSEVCQLIVALTRATKCCHLISCTRFGATWGLQDSVFTRWLAEHLQPVVINAAHFGA